VSEDTQMRSRIKQVGHVGMEGLAVWHAKTGVISFPYQRRGNPQVKV